MKVTKAEAGAILSGLGYRTADMRPKQMAEMLSRLNELSDNWEKFPGPTQQVYEGVYAASERGEKVEVEG